MGFIYTKKFLFVFILVAAGIVFFHRLGESPLAGDDCFYSEVAKEMALSGDYMSPQYAHAVNFHTSKPPVLFWINAVSGKLFGFNTAAMRLPSAALCFLGIIALLFFVNRYFDFITAFFAALILAFTQQYLYHARSAVTDGPFAVFFSLTLMAFWVARSEKRNSYFYLTGLFLGLAVMTRQIPGFFTLPAIFVYIVLSKEFEILKNRHFWLGLLLSAFIFMPWHILMYLRHGKFFLDQYLAVSLMTGLKGYPVSYAGNPSLNPWYAYYSIILSNYWPWLPLFAAGLIQSFRKLARQDAEKRKKFLYIISWFLVPLLIFQTAKVKQYHYIVPLYVPMAVLSASFLGSLSAAAKRKWILILVSVISAYTAACIIFPLVPKTLDSREYTDTIKLVPEVKQVKGTIHTIQRGAAHYMNCFWFYADKGTDISAENELPALIDSGIPGTFVLFKEDYQRLIKDNLSGKIHIIKETTDSVLFNNSK